MIKNNTPPHPKNQKKPPAPRQYSYRGSYCKVRLCLELTYLGRLLSFLRGNSRQPLAIKSTYCKHKLWTVSKHRYEIFLCSLPFLAHLRYKGRCQNILAISLPFLMSQGTFHGIRKLVQKGTGLPHILVLVCRRPVDVMDNLWHQTSLLVELCHALWVWIYTVTCFHFNEIFTEVSMPNHYYSICDFLHLFIEWQKSQSSDKECSDWWRHWYLSWERSPKHLSIICCLCDKVPNLFSCKLHFPFRLMRMINSSFQKCFERKPLSYRTLIESSPYIVKCENMSKQNVDMFFLYKHWQFLLQVAAVGGRERVSAC